MIDLHDELVDQLHQRIIADGLADGPRRADAVMTLVQAALPLAGRAVVADVADRVLARVEGLGPLEPLLDDDAVSDVLVNGGGRVYVERDGRLRPAEITLDDATVHHLLQRILAPLGLRADRRSPLVDARLPDGSRLNAVLPPLAVDGPCLAIRRFRARQVGLEEWGPPAVTDLLASMVGARWNVLVTGGTGSGKTTLLNSLASLVDPHERIITIEDAAELRLGHDHVVRLESRPANAEGAGAASIRALLRNALRMRPDRLVIGEVRGAEAVDLLHALNTGHDGSLSTIHSNGPADAVRRLATMVLAADEAIPAAAVAEQLHAAVDAVVHVRRGTDGRRRVVAVDELADRPGGPVTVPLLDPAGGCRAPSRRPRSWEDRP